MKELTIELTNHCSQKCNHCSTNAQKEGEIFISTDKFSEILDKFSDFDEIRLSGGEPFEHPKISKFINEAKRREKFVRILSSGVYYNSPIPYSLLRDSRKVDLISYSIYGGKKIHEKVCGVEGAFSNLEQSINNTLSNKIPLSFNYVAMKSSIDGLKEAAYYISKLKNKASYCNPKLKILRFVKQGRAEEHEDLALNENELKIIRTDCEKLSKQYNLEINLGCSIIIGSCTAKNEKMAVTAYDEIISCSALKYNHPSKKRKFQCSDRW